MRELAKFEGFAMNHLPEEKMREFPSQIINLVNPVLEHFKEQNAAHDEMDER